nr:reverse transcriptase domain-containing protein [Tanacetum cinerariifolium]
SSIDKVNMLVPSRMTLGFALILDFGQAISAPMEPWPFGEMRVEEGYTLVRQKKRGQAHERARAIQAKVQKLVDARIMREVYYHDWLSNPVMVKKHDGSWRMCDDFMDLNRACPQDCYPLPKIDWKVESLCGYPFKCFLDAYKGYHQIQLAEADKKKLSIQDREWRNIELYVDDLVVKSHTKAEVVRDIEEPFWTLRKINIKLNPKKDIKKCIKKSDFRWTVEAEQAFQQLKQHLSDLPLLVVPSPQEELIMYLSTTYGAVSAVLMTERGTTQTPIYFISRALQGDVPQAAPAMAAQKEPWTFFTDGSSCVDGSGARLILTNPEGVEFTYALRFQFATSNNEAEYEALVAGLRIATQMGVKNIQVNVDSKLVANQVLETYVAKEDNMIKYLEIVKGLVSGFITFSISQVPQSKNKQADALSKITSTSFTHMSKQIANYSKDGVLLGDNKEARKLRLKACQYELREGVLYRRSFLTPWLRCVRPLQADYVMREIYEGSCSMHAGPRSVVAKAIRLGYYWPIIHKDARDMIRKCNDWNRHSRPFSRGPGKVKFLIVAMDYFTKWVEAKAVATITGGQVKRFVWDNIVCRFEIRMPTHRTASVDVVNNDKELRLNLELLEERHERATICEAKAKSNMMKYYNARVRGVAFKPGDFVYRSNDASHAVAGGKLGPKWEGPYEVTEALGNRAYKLRSTDGTVLPRT